MGIRGLTSFINDQSYKFLRYFELNNTTLVIDGNCIMVQLYYLNKCNCCFGGEYAEYAYYVSEFLDELLECKVTPVIVIDGAFEDKKLSTLYSRIKQRIQSISISTPSNDQNLLPILTKYVFIYLARQRNIKIIQSTLEADDHIASVARILNCPVLSFDSDFYIYDVMYVPFDTLKQGIFKNSSEGGFVKHCKVFDRDKFLQEYSNMNKNLLPLAAVVLGNDYINANTFNNFFCDFKVLKSTALRYSTKKLHLRIAALLGWIQKHTLDSAISKIISKIDPDKQQAVLTIIEMIINGYLNPSSKMLHPLGYSEEEISILVQKMKYEPYKFQIPEIFYIESENENYIEMNLCYDENSQCEHEIYDIVKREIEDDLEKIVPTWFLTEYNKANFPPYFLDILNRQHILVSEQMEDFSYPTVITISFKIIKVIFRLLTNGITNTTHLKYTTRGKNYEIGTFVLDCKNDTLDYEIPLLENLIQFPFLKRKHILLNTLGLFEDSLINFPPEWRLYIAAIKYWLDSAEQIFRTNYHLYTLVLLIVFHVVKKVCQCHSDFEKNENIDMNHKESINQDQYFPSVDKPIKNALEELTADDCYWAKRFFTSNIYINKDFNISAVHGFSLFQNCLRYSIDLNTLLGCPLQKINVADFFSGTLVYNLYNDLKNYKKLNLHICDIFKKSPSVVQLFVSLSTAIKTLSKKNVKAVN